MDEEKRSAREVVSNYTRPINSGIGLRGDTTIASIILYENPSIVSEDDENPFDYLNDYAQKVVQPLGKMDYNGSKRNVAMLDLSNDDYIGIFNNILLTSVSESHSVIQKLHLNFSNSWNVFFFSDNPVMLTINGGFLDNEMYPYYQEFMMAYEKYLSGAKTAGKDMSMILSYDGKIVDGYITGIQVNTNVSTEGYKQFQMSFLAKKITWARYNYIRSAYENEGIDTNISKRTYNNISNLERMEVEYGLTKEEYSRFDQNNAEQKKGE